jgi:phosphocarrier protein
MASRTVAIGSTVGLHVRPATLLVQAVNAAGIPVTVGRPGGKPVPANSVLMIMALGVKCGEEVELSAEGDGSDQLLDQLATLLATNLDDGTGAN